MVRRLFCMLALSMLLFGTQASAADKQLDMNSDGYIDDALIPSTITRDSEVPQTAADVPFVPNGSISSTDVQAAVQEVRDEAGSGSGTTNLTNTPTANDVQVESSTGTNTTLAPADSDIAGVMTSADKVKLDGIDESATSYFLGLTDTPASYTANYYVKVNAAGDGLEFTAATGGGDVTGPASSTDNAFPRYDGSTGKLLQAGQTTEDDSGNVTVAGTLTAPVYNSSAPDGDRKANFPENSIAPSSPGTSEFLYNRSGALQYHKNGALVGELAATIASGTATLGTAAIASGACAAAVVVTATGMLTTDVIDWGFNGDPTSTTGYDPATGVLTIFAYPTADNVNFKVCNLTAASITPGAITLNWRVER